MLGSMNVARGLERVFFDGASGQRSLVIAPPYWSFILALSTPTLTSIPSRRVEPCLVGWEGRFDAYLRLSP